MIADIIITRDRNYQVGEVDIGVIIDKTILIISVVLHLSRDCSYKVSS